MKTFQAGGRRATPEERELAAKSAALATLEGQLADRELDLATRQAELSVFEARYFRLIGRLYAELDEVEAQMAEAVARHRPSDGSLKEKAAQARAKALESGTALASAPKAQEGRFNPGDEVRKLYREIARQLHPDLSTDAAHRARRTLLMAQANAAYANGDAVRLQAILDDWHSSPEAVEGDGVGAELIRTIRRTHQVEERVRSISEKMSELDGSELSRLCHEVASAETFGRDLLAEMALQLTSRIAAARARLRQVSEREVGQ